jgi:outer membrane protein TolC
LAIASVRHEQGVSTYLEFTETNLALSTARMQMVEAMHAHAVAQVRVRYATGNLPVEGKAEYDGK